MEQRRQNKMFSTWDEVRVADGLSEAAFATLQEKAALGAVHVLQNDNVGPQIGAELATKGIMAMVLSFLGMLAYIWYRFELRFGVGALVAVFHDFLITLGLYALLNFEFNLPTIAAFLTLVGYSVNDTVVIFDRVRENMARYRRMNLVELINLSLNQTLSRTVLTSGTTLLVVCCLFFLGGEVLRGFAFVLMVGVVIGTYSSIFVASPFTLLWEKHFGADSVRTKKAAPGTA
jgi:preprotein translocase subunit SecF